MVLSVKSYSQNCNSIKKKIDKFDGTITYSTPLILHGSRGLGAIRPPYLMASKSFTKTDTVYALSLVTTGASLNAQAKGATLLLSDGTQIPRPDASVSIKPSTNYGWEYTVSIALTRGEIDNLLKNSLTDFKIDIFEGNISPQRQSEFSEYLKCLKVLLPN